MKKKKEKIFLKPFKPLHDKWMKNPEYKKAYDELEFEFQLIRALIDTRAKKGLTQEKLARLLGTKQSAIARFETGKANPRLSFMKKLTRALDVKLTLTR